MNLDPGPVRASRRIWRALPLLVMCAAPAHADLGRLFHTPAERAALDNARVRNVVEAPRLPAAAILPQAYQGYVKRSDGFSQHWVDGSPAGDAAPGLKPGQRRVDGQVRESYQSE